MALYEELGAVDIITPVQNMFENEFRLCMDGKLRLIGDDCFLTNGPWINVRTAVDRACFLWSQIYYRCYKIIPRGCFNCWKLVARPRSLTELIKVHKLQVRMDLPSKSGIERREYGLHKGIYGSYWYCPMEGGYAGALEHLAMIQKTLHKEISKSLKVVLKRSCTEMENSAGPSDAWVYPEEQHMLEDVLDSVWDIPPDNCPEPMVLKTTIMRRWIEHGITHRDPEAMKYIESMESLGVAPTKTYEKLAEAPKSPIYRVIVGGENIVETSNPKAIERLASN